METLNRGFKVALGLSALALCVQVHGETFPSRPVTFIVPYPAGAAGDFSGRVVAEKLSQIWKQPVIVQNKPGVGGVLGMASVLQLKPDGYTLVLTTASVTLTLAQQKAPTFDHLKDFEPVSLLITSPMMLVAHKNMPFNTPREWVEYAKAYPDKLFYGGTGVGGLGNLAGELIMLQTGGKMSYVPFQGGVQSLAAVVGNQTPMAFNDVGTARAQMKTGTIKPLLVAQPNRSPLVPDVPSLGDMGIKDIDIRASHGVMVAKGTPPEIVREIADQIKAIMTTPEVRERFIAAGLDPVGSTPQGFTAFLKAEDAQFRRGIKLTGLEAGN
ncbi:Bug family tripartite tricarboxylate transporter substrate binding protein [Hydrogenophaga sp. OTU3427]|uniref:Bug family tripartite tricarboxylate transporter substrate binding protein n=1 Tax=Hydrogenophaga sp. OTU3427 TaxID=3043856 RepID=UPI00313B9015